MTSYPTLTLDCSAAVSSAVNRGEIVSMIGPNAAVHYPTSIFLAPIPEEP